MQPVGVMLLLLVLSSVHAGESDHCPPDWSYHGELCYGYGATAVPWGSAQAICSIYGGRLAEPSSVPESYFVTTMARHKLDSCVWVGGNDIFQEGVWEWSSRSRPFYSFMNWADGEPNNDRNNEDCLNLPRPLNYKWNDGLCTINCNFICAAPNRPLRCMKMAAAMSTTTRRCDVVTWHQLVLLLCSLSLSQRRCHVCSY